MDIKVGYTIPSEIVVTALYEEYNELEYNLEVKGEPVDWGITSSLSKIRDILEDNETKINKLEQQKQKIQEKINKLKQENV